MRLENDSKYPFHTYQVVFMLLWKQCIEQGYSSQDAREFAQMEWENLKNR